MPSIRFILFSFLLVVLAQCNSDKKQKLKKQEILIVGVRGNVDHLSVLLHLSDSEFEMKKNEYPARKLILSAKLFLQIKEFLIEHKYKDCPMEFQGLRVFQTNNYMDTLIFDLNPILASEFLSMIFKNYGPEVWDGRDPFLSSFVYDAEKIGGIQLRLKPAIPVAPVYP